MGLSVCPFVVCLFVHVFIRTSIRLVTPFQQGWIHGVRCYETPFSAVEETALRTDGWTDGPTDGRIDPLIEVIVASKKVQLKACVKFI